MHLQNSYPSSQEVKRINARISAAVLLSVVGIGLSPLVSAEDVALGPKAPSPIVTAPPLKLNPLTAARPAPGQAPLEAGMSASPAPSEEAASAKAAVSLAEDEGAPWVLKPESRPLPLRYREAQPVGSLYLDVPSMADARLMLPGRVADSIDHNRTVISKYITDVIGVAAQARGRQQDAVDSWIAETDKQRHLLQQDPWTVYQFSLESRKELASFRESIAGQTAPGISEVVEEVKRAISQLAPLVSALPTYELQQSWYNLMVQLKEGVSLYQVQVRTSDQKILDRIDAYLEKNPAVARPAGNPPSKEQLNTPSARQQIPVEPSPTMMTVQKPLEPAKKLAQEKPSSDSLGGLLVVGGLFALGGFFVLRLRKRKGATPTAQAN